MKQAYRPIIFFLVLASSVAGTLEAQQAGHYSLYMMNKLNWNPAYAGLDHSLSINGAFRTQWVGLGTDNSDLRNGNPVSQQVSAHLPLYIFSSGVGINFENESLGAGQNLSATFSYNYQLGLGSGILSIGLAGGITQRTLDGSLLRTPEGIYEGAGIIDHQDDLLPVGKESAQSTTFSAGVYYQTERFEFGLSARNLTEQEVEFNGFSLLQQRTFFFNGGARFDLNTTLSLHPSVFVRSDLNELQTDVSVLLRFNGNIFGGASFRGYKSDSIDAVAMLAGFKLSEKITLAYAYDLTLSDINLAGNGSHEIMLTYNLNKQIGKGRLPNVIYNPRSL